MHGPNLEFKIACSNVDHESLSTLRNLEWVSKTEERLGFQVVRFVGI